MLRHAENMHKVRMTQSVQRRVLENLTGMLRYRCDVCAISRASQRRLMCRLSGNPLHQQGSGHSQTPPDITSTGGIRPKVPGWHTVVI